jgi:hypothetical protein
MSDPEGVARNMMALDVNSKEFIRQRQPQRSIPQIILSIGIRIDNKEIVRWVLDKHPNLAVEPITADTLAVVDEVFRA